MVPLALGQSLAGGVVLLPEAEVVGDEVVLVCAGVGGVDEGAVKLCCQVSMLFTPSLELL